VILWAGRYSISVCRGCERLRRHMSMIAKWSSWLAGRFVIRVLEEDLV
jgi:hypothetical protein